MPVRRPYASRGVPRRVTTHRAGPGHSSVAGPAALLTVVTLIVAGCIWIADPGLFGVLTSLLLGVSQNPDAAKQAGSPQTADVQAAPQAGGPELQMVQVAGAAPTSVGGSPTPTMLPTLRQWESNAPGLVTDPGLVARLDQALVGVDGHVSVAVKDLGSGRGAALDGDQEMPAASLYKLPVLYTAFEAGLNMGEELPITEEARAFDTGTMELGVGETLSVSEALERMVTLSDNTSAVMLGSRVGGGRITANLAALGMDTTHYSLERMTTSALDMLHLLDLMAQGKAVSSGASADMVHLLLRQRVNDRLPRLLPEDVQIAHKTGNLPGTVNDVGIVYGPSSTVGIAVLISDTTDETAAATGVARVAQAAYAYFGSAPEVAGRPTIPRAPVRPIPPVWRQPNPPTPTPIPTVEPSPSPEPAPVQAVLPPTPNSTLVRAATPLPTATPTPPAPVLVPTPPAPTATPAPHPATPTPTPIPPQPTHAATRAPTAAATPTPGHH